MKVWKFGDNINTDDIIPAKYLNTTDEKELARHCLENVHSKFIKEVKPNDIIIAGENFGCGSSREHAPIAIKSLGIFCIIAKSFARIFYRNAINIGLPILECKELVDEVKEGEEIEINLFKGEIKFLDKIYKSAPFPNFMQELIKEGGLMEYIKKGVKR